MPEALVVPPQLTQGIAHAKPAKQPVIRVPAAMVHRATEPLRTPARAPGAGDAGVVAAAGVA